MKFGRFAPLGLLVTLLFAARHADAAANISASRASAPPLIDGRLDDLVWRTVPVDDHFTQQFPDEGRPASQPTKVQVAYDDDALYIAVRCDDAEPHEIVERLTRRDRDTEADGIAVEISSKGDHASAYHFGVNVSGVLTDGVRFNDVDYSGDWDGLWLGAAHRDDSGWSAELKIPFKTLRYEGGRTEFGLQVRRFLQRRQEVDEWAPIVRGSRREVSGYGRLTGLTGLHPKRLFQIVPYLAAGLQARYGQPPLDGANFYGNAGADLKLGVTPALTLDATFNPDFGQIEADQVILNLTTFELQFPEKRPFFLEGVDVFATPVALLYSRRIGHAPPSPNGYDLAEPLPAGRIWAALKLTGAVGRRLTLGLLEALTDAPPLVVEASGRRLLLRTDPLSNYAAVRLKRDLLSHSSIGFMGTAVTRFEAPYAAAPSPGDLCPDEPGALSQRILPASDGRCSHDAFTGGVDALLVTHDSQWGVRTHLIGSLLHGGPVRPLADGKLLRPGDRGVGLFAEGGKLGGRLVGTLAYHGYSPKLDLNDAGYLRQANLHELRAELGARLYKPAFIALQGNSYVGTLMSRSWDGRANLVQMLYLKSWVQLRNYWMLFFEVDYDFPRDDNRETRDGALTERAPGASFFLWGKSDSRRRLVVEGEGGFMQVAHGYAFNTSWTLRARLIPALELDLISRANWTYGDPRWFDTRDNGDGSRTWRFANLESRSFDVTLRATYTFLPTLSLQAYAQLFFDGGHYSTTVEATASGAFPRLRLADFQPAALVGNDNDFRDGTINVNLVLRWELRPGSTLLLAYSHLQKQTDFALDEGAGRPRIGRFVGGPGSDLLLLKLSLLID